MENLFNTISDFLFGINRCKVSFKQWLKLISSNYTYNKCRVFWTAIKNDLQYKNYYRKSNKNNTNV